MSRELKSCDFLRDTDHMSMGLFQPLTDTEFAEYELYKIWNRHESLFVILQAI